MIHVLAYLPHWLGWFESTYWPENGPGYAIDSSIGGDTAIVASAFAMVAVVIKLWKKHPECEVETCKRHGYGVEGTSHHACRPHHPHKQGVITVERIASAARLGHRHPAHRLKYEPHQLEEER
jgi:hypothetical protein